MNRKATPKLNVLRPSASTPAALSSPGTARAVMIAPAYSEPIPRSTAHLTRNARPMARTTTRPGRLELRERLLEQQQRPEDEQEDADPRQARPSRVVGSPLPVVDLDRGLTWSATAAVRAEPGHRFVSVVHHRASCA